MTSQPWHVGYFADEGEFYEWGPDEEEDDQGDGLDPFDDLRRKLPDPDDLDAIKGGKPLSTTSIAATAMNMEVTAQLIADMQRQLGHLPESFNEGLKPIYGPERVPGSLLNQVVASSETQITQLQSSQNSRSQKPLPQSESPEGLTRKVFTALWSNKSTVVVGVVATGALIYILPKGGGGGALPAFARVAGPLGALFVKTGRHAVAEAEFQDKLDNFDYAGEEMADLGVV